MDLTPQQIRTLQLLQQRAFATVAFPMYPNHIGVRKGNCAALLAPVAAGTFAIFGTPSYLIAGNLTVRVRQNSQDWFVWKKERLEANPARLAELGAFIRELTAALEPQPQ